MDVIHISFGGPDRKIKDQNGDVIVFEDHPHFGPHVLDKRGDPKDTQPGQHASFWRVCRWWVEQGRQIDADGLCVWAKPPEQKIEHIAGNHYRLVYDDVVAPAPKQEGASE